MNDAAPPLSPSGEALAIVLAYVDEPLEAAVEGARLEPDAATPETLLIMIRAARARLAALATLDLPALDAASAREWIVARTAAFAQRARRRVN